MRTIDAGMMIRIPDNTRRDGDLIYLDEFVIGIIGPLCPDGFMELTAPSNVIVEIKSD